MSDAELLATALIEAKPTETELDQKKFCDFVSVSAPLHGARCEILQT
jgi:hypothetical protein